MAPLEYIAQVVLTGIGATIVMDAWLLFVKTLGAPTLDYAFVGRWLGHLCRGKFAHADIRETTPVGGESALGWAAHYATGIAFAAGLAYIQGAGWLRDPTLAPALVAGVATVVVPLFIVQPAMGAGFASANTPAPARNCLRSVVTHTVFGFGLYWSATVTVWAWK
jgi:hypothetical protein